MYTNNVCIDIGLYALFVAILSLDSPSGREGTLANWLFVKLASLGACPRFDGAAVHIGSECGNLLGSIAGQGRLANEKPIMLVAHMDTASSTMGLVPRCDDGWVHTDGRTALGADDKAGIAVILMALRRLRTQGKPHLPIEIVFTVAEEIGLLGCRHLDRSTLFADEAIVCDSSGRVGSLVIKSVMTENSNVIYMWPTVRPTVERSLPTTDVSSSHPLVERFAKAAVSAGLDFEAESTGALSDANILSSHGITAVNMGLGIEAEHTAQERIHLSSLQSAIAVLTEVLGMSRHELS